MALRRPARSLWPARALWKSALVAAAIALPAGSADAQQVVKKCSTAQLQDIAEAHAFVVANARRIADSVNFGKRKKRERKIRNRYVDQIPKNRYVCRPEKRCDHMHGRKVAGRLSNKIRLCHSKMVNSTAGTATWRGWGVRYDGFCFLVDIIAHESAHAAGWPRKRPSKHGRSTQLSDLNDSVYLAGFVAGRLCKTAGLDRELRAP